MPAVVVVFSAGIPGKMKSNSDFHSGEVGLAGLFGIWSGPQRMFFSSSRYDITTSDEDIGLASKIIQLTKYIRKKFHSASFQRF